MAISRRENFLTNEDESDQRRPLLFLEVGAHGILDHLPKLGKIIALRVNAVPQRRSLVATFGRLNDLKDDLVHQSLRNLRIKD